jgi:MFS transporter, FHS family, L-fucose permease
MSKSEDRMFVTADGRRVWFTFALVSSLFLLWGFCNGMIDVMDKHFQDELGLTKAQSARVQFAHYLGYFLMAMPAGWLATRLGYKGGIIVGLLMVAAGGFWFIPATKIAQAAKANIAATAAADPAQKNEAQTAAAPVENTVGGVSQTTAFRAFLVGVCAIAAGLTFLETIANPYATVLGAEKYAATRINLAQSCNGIGWIFGPIVGSMFFYGTDAAGASTGSQTLYIPYVGVAVVVLLLAGLFAMAPMPDIKTEDHFHLDDQEGSSTKSIWAHPHFIMAVVAQFFYVAAQAGIFSFFINYMTEETPEISAGLEQSFTSFTTSCPQFMQGWLGGWTETVEGIRRISDKGAANLASLGFVCFLLGRFTGAGLMKKYSAAKLLGIYALLSIAACLVVFAKWGWWSALAVFASYFFMSIMFPTIFALGIHGLGSRAKQASSFLVMAIMGGALLPPKMGEIADNYDMSAGFIVPTICFVVVAAYGFLWPKLVKA